MQSSTRSLSLPFFAIPKPQTCTNVRCRPQLPEKRRIRGFASSASTQNMVKSGRIPKDIVSRLPRQQSMKTQMKNLPKSELSNDFGFLPKTFVYGPATGKYPTLFSAPKKRLRIEWLRITQAVQGLLTGIYMCRWGVQRHPITGRRMKKPMLLRERGIAARDLHKQFYTALAEGDVAKIRNLACKGLEERARIQIEQRKATNKSPQKFRIQKYNGWNAQSWLIWPFANLLPFQSTRVVTDKIVPLSQIGQNSTLRQCVVRIRAQQTLDRGTGTGPESKILEEYVVIQKLAINGEEQPWRIWGTVNPSSTEEIFQIMGSSFAPVRTVFDMIKEKFSSMTGGVI